MFEPEIKDVLCNICILSTPELSNTNFCLNMCANYVSKYGVLDFMNGALSNGIILRLLYIFRKWVPSIAHMENKSEA